MLVAGRLVKTSTLKRRLLREGVLRPRCAGCGLERWRDTPIPLELDHVSGDRSDNRLENLRLLCPNCHAQTETYRGRNIANGIAVARPCRGATEVEAAQVRATLSRGRLRSLFPATAVDPARSVATTPP